MNFKSVSISDREILTSYFFKYGESSCQYSFAAMLGLKEKYGDEYFIEDDILYIHRSNRDYENYRVYLAPLCPKKSNIKAAVNRIVDDAHSHGCLASFETVTGHFLNSLQSAFDENEKKVTLNDTNFSVIEDRDYAEYIYSTEKMSILPGRALAAKRNRVRAFYSAYDGHIKIENITHSNIDDVIALQKKWIEARRKEGIDEMLETENIAIHTYFENFKTLGFSGIIVYVYGTPVGYAAGVPLSESTFDEVIEKGLPEITGIYQLLCNEFALICCKDYKYLNREEDIGIEGLRRAKLSYEPEILLSKYVMREN